MQKLRCSFIFLLTICSLITYGQFSVTGKIIDAESKEPLNSASVYCQNTTIGTTTNKQGEFSLQLKSGGYELIISYTGYQTKQVQINHSDSRIPDIEMAKEEKSLGEVIIKTSNEVKDGWAKYGSFFTEHFIGKTPNAAQTTLLNPEVLKFYLLKKSNRLRVLATEPLQIENKALGYNLRYQLDSFLYNYNTNINSYRGFCLYSEMEGDESLKKVWAVNREKAYYGSKLHFMRSYYDSAVLEEGFIIDMLDEANDKKFNKVTDVYDTLYYGALSGSAPDSTVQDSTTQESSALNSIAPDSTMQIEIWYPRKISVTYAKKKPEPEYLRQFKLPKNVPIQISYIDITNPIVIMENGYYYDQKDWINQGYWSWKNLADQLPYDY